MNPYVIAIGMIGAVILVVLVSSTGIRAQSARNSQGQWTGSQGFVPWQKAQEDRQQDDGGRQPETGDAGNGGDGSRLMQLFAIVGVLAVVTICLVIFLALQDGL